MENNYMKTYKELMLYFLVSKNEIIFSTTNISLFDIYDWEYFNVWTEEMCQEFIEEVCVADSDIDICPYCLLYINDDCRGCYFGLKNGNCIDDENSKYKNITIKLADEVCSTSILPLKGIQDLIYEIRKYKINVRN